MCGITASTASGVAARNCTLLATPAGRQELQQLQARYQECSGRLRPGNTSVITYILVHERERGLLSG
jgi:hypothetical protein